MNTRDVQGIVLRAPHGRAVAHLILRIPQQSGRAAADWLSKRTHASFGIQFPSNDNCSLGFSFAGLEAIGLPKGYLRLFRRLAPAFSDGAMRRSARLGDQGASAAPRWHPAFAQDRAHAILTWNGSEKDVKARAALAAAAWESCLRVRLADPFTGKCLVGPDNQAGDWMHFGFRDGLSEICIDDDLPRPAAPDVRRHAPGALLLGRINDNGSNPFVLNQAPDKVRRFFLDSSFGIFRPMAQDLAGFEQQVSVWTAQMQRVLGPGVTRAFVKAKLCGRWPDGRLLRPGELTPAAARPLTLDLAADPAGEGCPFGSHVRRMRATPDARGTVIARPLQRRGVPFGPAAWDAAPTDGERRGLLGHFFCASIEDQFEHLLGQWAARPTLGPSPDDRALDPMIGPHDDPGAGLRVPLQGLAAQSLRGFSDWTTTLGTMYAWYPSRSALHALLTDDFVPDDLEGPWL